MQRNGILIVLITMLFLVCASCDKEDTFINESNEVAPGNVDEQGRQNSGAIFAAGLGPSHRSEDDPVGDGGHMHNFNGNKCTNQESTRATLRECEAIANREPVDRSAAWVPSLEVGGVEYQPEPDAPLYYGGTPGLDEKDVVDFPVGQELIFKESNGSVQWKCGPTGLTDQAPASCDDMLTVRFESAECWDGSGNNYTDMVDATSEGCPEGHKRVPEIRWAPSYDLTGSEGNIRVIGGHHTTVTTHRMHADWVDGWKHDDGSREDLRSLIVRCINNVPHEGPRPEYCRDP